MDANELYDPEFRKLIKEKNPTIIIPVGSIEQHGAHLPITTDSDIVTEIASRLAKKCGFIVFPTISYGISEEHDPLFHISLKENTLLRILKSIHESLFHQGRDTKMIILNGHHGNVGALNNIRQAVPHVFVEARQLRSYSYWHFMEHEFDHAGFVETSIMLAISDKVKMQKAEKGLITKGLSDEEIQRINKLSTQPGGFPKVAKNGVWGDPTGATKKDGEKFLAEIVRNLAKECQS
jgi:creatinine amidohydrolase